MRGLSRLLLGVAVLATACATTEPKDSGPRSSEHPASIATTPTDSASLIVFRPGSGRARQATVLIDGKEVGIVEQGAFNVFSVPAGTHRLAARVKTWSGLCEITVNPSGGSRSFFEISPSATALVPLEQAALLGTFFASALLPYVGYLVQGLGSVAEVAIESIRNECGGFTVQQVDEATARSKLDELRATR